MSTNRVYIDWECSRCNKHHTRELETLDNSGVLWMLTEPSDPKPQTLSPIANTAFILAMPIDLSCLGPDQKLPYSLEEQKKKI